MLLFAFFTVVMRKFYISKCLQHISIGQRSSKLLANPVMLASWPYSMDRECLDS
jgi:hypothetical protein